MAAKIFDDILLKGVRTGRVPGKRDSREWFRSQAKKVATVGALNLLSEADRSTKPALGKMQFFFYDPKTKKQLPFYDKFPLIFPFRIIPGGFYGINMHYLPPRQRAILMDALYDLASQKNVTEDTKLRMTFKILDGAAKYRFFKPAVKRYLNGHVKSQFGNVPATDWDIALFLPTARWAKASQSTVFADTRKQLNS